MGKVAYALQHLVIGKERRVNAHIQQPLSHDLVPAPYPYVGSGKQAQCIIRIAHDISAILRELQGSRGGAIVPVAVGQALVMVRIEYLQHLSESTIFFSSIEEYDVVHKYKHYLTSEIRTTIFPEVLPGMISMVIFLLTSVPTPISVQSWT